MLSIAKDNHALLLSAAPHSHKSAPDSSYVQSISCVMTDFSGCCVICHLALLEMPAAYLLYWRGRVVEAATSHAAGCKLIGQVKCYKEEKKK